MKKYVLTLLAVVFAFSLAACGQEDNEEGTASNNAGSNEEEVVTLVVGATPVPHAEILEVVKPILAEQGVELDIKQFNDYVLPNTQLVEQQLDANFFQHRPYLAQFNEDHSETLVEVAGVHIEPLGAYSNNIESIDELEEGATIAIPNDLTNQGRALALLEKNGLITLAEDAGVSATLKDIETNEKNYDIKELEAAMLPRTLAEVDLAIINTNFVVEIDLAPMEDALFFEEDANSPYVNILVTREDNKENEAIKKLAEALNSDEVKKYFEENGEGKFVPVF
ncbi:MetQ/NlpA family ABC transporter substrate-binding protein [Longirhabdus pacifica]|uniref:MetQ/NlpA family ABC transporter substrate-binding protein n=1 Tax=Longirhabdus pacifica TaxID=2305227 RepID=UPI00100930C6|nr:MetQ/NlpA family ABC transporter substrate-binding protein [Longirhabdus pacifica]